MVVGGGEIPGAEASCPRHPDRRVRLLDRAGPQVHHRELVILAVPGKHFLRLPGLHDQVMGLVIAVPVLYWRNAVAKVGVHGGPQGHTGHQPATADAVQHPVFLGDSDGRVGGWQRGTHLHDRHILAVGGPGQGGTHQVGSGHEPVGILVVLIDTQPVQSGLGGVRKLVQRPVVVLPDLLCIGQFRPGRVYPDRVVPLLEIRWKVAVRHQVKHRDFHDCSL